MKSFKVQVQSEGCLFLKPNLGTVGEMIGIKKGDEVILTEDQMAVYGANLNSYILSGKMVVSEVKVGEKPKANVVVENAPALAEGNDSDIVLPAQTSNEEEITKIKEQIKGLTVSFKAAADNATKSKLREEIAELKKKIGSLK